MPDYSTAAIVRKGDKYLLAKRLPGGSMGGRWEFPGGKAEEGESPEAALEREFREEFEIPLKVGKHLVSTTFRNREKEFTLLAFAGVVEAEISVLAEHEEVRWLPLTEIAELDLADSDRKIYELLRDLK